MNASDHLPICIIDDDASVRDGTASLLRSAGYRAESFDSAEAFLRSGDPRRFACVVTDIQMPGMSGIDLAYRLDRGEPPVILVTARSEDEVLAKAAASPAAFLLRKPYAAERLLDCLRRAVSDYPPIPFQS